MNKRLFFSLLVLAAVGVFGCKKEKDPGGTPAANSPDRAALLRYWADSVVVPGYGTLEGKLAALKAKTAAFVAAPDAAALADARQAWRVAYGEWQNVELFELGPAEGVGLRNRFNIYPADVAGIERNISAGTYNFELATAIPQQGFPALDYLLNGVGADDQAIVQRYTTSAGHRRYLTDVVAEMDRLLATVAGQWRGAYRDTFVGSTGTDAGSSLSKVVNAYSQYFERDLRAGKIGIPAGVMTGTPLPDRIEAYYHGGTLPLELALTAHRRVQTFFIGRAGQPSLKRYLDALGAKDSRTGQALSAILEAQLATSYQKLGTLGPDLKVTVTTRNAEAVEAYNEMQKAVRMIKVDMTSALGITLTYVDNDGD